MGDFDQEITRANISTLEQQKYTAEIFTAAQEKSVVMTRARKLPNLGASVTNMPVMSALPVAYFTGSDAGLKKTTKAQWENKQLNVKEIAVIVPIPEAVIDDANVDIWAQVKPSLAEAIGNVFDGAVLFGTNAPSGWPTNIRAGCVAASHTVTLGTGPDLYADLMSDTGVFSLLEADGYLATACAADASMRGRLRNVRDANGNPIFKTSIQDSTRYELDGAPVDFVMNGSWDAILALMIAGFWSELVWAVRQDITYKILTEAVIQDAAGEIVFNLAQQDMVALRCTFRCAWQISNPIKRKNTNSATRYPFAALLP